MSNICPICTVALEKQANHCVFHEYLSWGWGSRKWLGLGVHSISVTNDTLQWQKAITDMRGVFSFDSLPTPWCTLVAGHMKVGADVNNEEHTIINILLCCFRPRMNGTDLESRRITLPRAIMYTTCERAGDSSSLRLWCAHLSADLSKIFPN